jgi:hypothetical protein
MNLHKTIVFENEFTKGVPGHSTQLVDLTLQDIVKNGGVKNPYESFILGYLSSFFSAGYKSVDLELEGPVTFGTAPTAVQTKEYIQKLTSVEQVQLAQYLLDCIIAGESMLYDKEKDCTEWIKFVLRKQD